MPKLQPGLLARLTDELRDSGEFGQPLIEEFEFPRTGLIRATVIWDEWAELPDEDRAATILRAYEQVEGKEYSEKIAIAIGLTVQEARDSGLLPYAIATALRKDDPVTPEQCAQAMLDQGASMPGGRGVPLLLFATENEAEAARRRLIDALPGSEPVWLITKEVGRIED